MENIQAYKALLKVAEENGVSLNEVVTEIETAIRDSIEQAIQDNNVEALAMWAQIPCQGEYPSAVELITHIGGQIYITLSAAATAVTERVYCTKLYSASDNLPVHTASKSSRIS